MMDSGIMSARLRCVLLVMVALFVTCKDRLDLVRSSEVPGLYHANYSAGLLDELEIRPDSIYIRRFISFDSVEYVDTGRYGLYMHITGSEARMPTIVLDSFVDHFPIKRGYEFTYADDSDALVDTTPRFWSAPVRKYKEEDSAIYIWRSEYFRQGYVKVE